MPFRVYVYDCYCVLMHFYFIQCFDAVGWVTGRAPDLYKNPVSTVPSVFPLEDFREPGLMWTSV